MDLYNEWTTASEERETEIWQEMLKIYASQCYTIGLVSGVLQPIAMRKTMKQHARGGDLQLGAARPVRHLSCRIRSGTMTHRPA